jgi:hypothetical protein
MIERITSQESANREEQQEEERETAPMARVRARPTFVIQDGCYLIRYEPIEPLDDVLFFEGTARFMHVMPDGTQFHAQGGDDPLQAELRAGADLYCRLGCRCDPDLRQKEPDPWKKDDPTQLDREKPENMPIFARKDYRYYLRATKIIENVAEDTVSISISVYEFNHDTEWPNPGSRWVCLKRVSPPKYRQFFEGQVLDQDSGQIVGRLTMCRVSRRLRSARVVIHRVKGVNYFPGYEEKAPEDAAKAKSKWEEAFKQAGWDIDLSLNQPNLQPAHPDEKTWTIGELQQALYVIRIQEVLGNYPGFDAIKPPGAAPKPIAIREMSDVELQRYVQDTNEFLMERSLDFAPPLPPKSIEEMNETELRDHIKSIKGVILQETICKRLKKMTHKETSEHPLLIPSDLVQIQEITETGRGSNSKASGAQPKPITIKEMSDAELQRYVQETNELLTKRNANLVPPLPAKPVDEMKEPELKKYIQDTQDFLKKRSLDFVPSLPAKSID